MAVRFQQKRDTAANWTSNNPTLLSGEVGFETDTNKFKFGDGSTAWTSLAYFISGGYTDRGDPSVVDFDGCKQYGNNEGPVQDHLVDDTATFQTKGVAVGDFVHNKGTTTYTTVTVVNSETDLTLAADIFQGDQASYTVGAINKDTNWNDLDLSSIVPAGATAVLFRGNCYLGNTGNSIKLRENGNSNEINISTYRTIVASAIEVEFSLICACDSNRKIECKITHNNNMYLFDLTVAGWWK